MVNACRSERCLRYNLFWDAVVLQSRTDQTIDPRHESPPTYLLTLAPVTHSNSGTTRRRPSDPTVAAVQAFRTRYIHCGVHCPGGSWAHGRRALVQPLSGEGEGEPQRHHARVPFARCLAVFGTVGGFIGVQVGLGSLCEVRRSVGRMRGSRFACEAWTSGFIDNV